MELKMVLNLKNQTGKLFLSFCIIIGLYSCTRLDLESRPSVFSGDSSGSHSSFVVDPMDKDPEEIWLIKEYQSNKVSSKTITNYEENNTIGTVKVTNLKKDDVVFIWAHFSLSNTDMFKSYVTTSITKSSTSLGQKNISVGSGMKYVTSNIMATDTIQENAASLTYKLNIKAFAEYTKWNSDKKILNGLSTQTTDIDRFGAIVYRKYKTTQILQEDPSPYYLQKVYFATDVQTQGTSGKKILNISSLSLKKDDLLMLQGQVQLLTITQKKENKEFYDYSLKVASELNGAGFSASIPGRKTTDGNNFPMSHRFFALHGVSADQSTDLSIKLQGADSKFNLLQEYENFSAWVFRKVSKENLKEDGTFYYLKSPEIQEYKTVFSKMPVAVTVKETLDASMIMSLDIGAVKEHDILDVKLDSSFSLDYATDDLHQYNFILMFRYPSLKINSQRSKGVFAPVNASNIFNVKQDLNLYFSTEATKSIQQETLTLYTTVKGEVDGENRFQNEYLNLNNFLITFQHWRKIIDLDPILESNEEEEDEEEDE